MLPPQDGSDTPGWVTLRDVYHCAIDKALFAKKIEQAQTYADDMGDDWITIDAAEMRGDEAQTFALTALGFAPHPSRPDRRRARTNAAVLTHVKAHTSRTTASGPRAPAPRDPAPRQSRASLVHPRLEHARQQDPVEHRGRRLRVPQHVRLAECRAGVLPARARGAAAPTTG